MRVCWHLVTQARTVDTMRIREILDLKGGTLYSIPPDGLLADAVSLMVKHDVGSLVVLRGDAMVGLVTFREVLAALDAGRGSLARRTVAEVMVKDPPCGQLDDTIDHMRGLMTELHVRYLPILEGGRLLGILSFHDVARAALKAASFENRLLKQYIKNWPEPDPADSR